MGHLIFYQSKGGKKKYYMIRRRSASLSLIFGEGNKKSRDQCLPFGAGKRKKKVSRRSSGLVPPKRDKERKRGERTFPACRGGEKKGKKI